MVASQFNQRKPTATHPSALIHLVNQQNKTADVAVRPLAKFLVNCAV